MRYGIIGAGAIGGYYGAKLAHAGQEVHFLLRSDYEYVRQHGLQVDSCDGSFHLTDLNVYLHTEDMPPCDVVLVCLKSVNNGKLQSLLPSLLHDHTLVVLIQNGIGVEEDVQKMFPKVQLAAGLAFICSAKTQPGVVSHQCYGSINLANYSCRDETQMQAVVDEFRQVGIETGLVDDRMYVGFLMGDRGMRAFRAFFQAVLSLEEGRALLWHCSDGKDRAGCAAMLLLYALGASEETVYQDYLLTNEYNEDVLEAARKKAEAIHLPPDKLDLFLILSGCVSRLYLENAQKAMTEHFGSVEGYLSGALGIGETERDLLRSRFLE